MECIAIGRCHDNGSRLELCWSLLMNSLGIMYYLLQVLFKYLQLLDSPSDSDVQNQKKDDWSHSGGCQWVKHSQKQVDFQVRHILHPRPLKRWELLFFYVVVFSSCLLPWGWWRVECWRKQKAEWLEPHSKPNVSTTWWSSGELDTRNWICGGGGQNTTMT